MNEKFEAVEPERGIALTFDSTGFGSDETEDEIDSDDVGRDAFEETVVGRDMDPELADSENCVETDDDDDGGRESTDSAPDRLSDDRLRTAASRSDDIDTL